jgi:hypothetical protein
MVERQALNETEKAGENNTFADAALAELQLAGAKGNTDPYDAYWNTRTHCKGDYYRSLKAGGATNIQVWPDLGRNPAMFEYTTRDGQTHHDDYFRCPEVPKPQAPPPTIVRKIY